MSDGLPELTGASAYNGAARQMHCKSTSSCASVESEYLAVKVTRKMSFVLIARVREELPV